jgi:8-oxo-dGTP diphosphatase
MTNASRPTRRDPKTDPPKTDPKTYECPSVAVDLVLMSIVDDAPAVLVMRRQDPPFAGEWALPGGFVRIDESLDDAARRILRDKARMEGVYVEQLYTFGALQRDPRMRVITTAYLALQNADSFAAALRVSSELKLAKVITLWQGETGGPAAIVVEGAAAPLAFDHAEILGTAMLRLRGKLDYSDVAFALLPETFTLRQLQDIYEAVLGVDLNKPAFRRRMVDKGWLEATGARESGASFRPAELFRRRAPNPRK